MLMAHYPGIWNKSHHSTWHLNLFKIRIFHLIKKINYFLLTITASNRNENSLPESKPD